MTHSLPTSPVTPEESPLHGEPAFAREASTRPLLVACLIATHCCLLSRAAAAQELAPRPPDLVDVKRTPEAESEVARLKPLWADWHERISTYRIRGWRFIGGHLQLKNAVSRESVLSLIREEFVVLMEKVSSGETTLDRTRLFGVSNPFFPIALDDGSYGIWQQFELTGTMDDRAARYKFDDEERTLVRREGREQEYSSLSNQVSLRPEPSPLQMEDLSTFLHTPELFVLTRLEAGEGGRQVLINGSSEKGFRLEYDAESGFVFRDTRHIDPTWYVPERVQELPFETSEGIPFPRVCARVSYHKQTAPPVRVRSLHLYLVESVELNVPVGEDAFRIAVPAGTVIVNFGEGMQRPSTDGTPRHQARRVPEAVPDAVAASREESFTPPAPRHTPAPLEADPAERGAWPVRVILIANGVAVTLILLAAWRVAARRQRGRCVLTTNRK